MIKFDLGGFPDSCGSPLNACHLYGDLYYTKFRTKVNKKTSKKHKHFLDHEEHELKSHRERRGHREVGFTGRGVDGLVYANSQPYSKRACAFGLRSLSKL